MTEKSRTFPIVKSGDLCQQVWHNPPLCLGVGWRRRNQIQKATQK